MKRRAFLKTSFFAALSLAVSPSFSHHLNKGAKMKVAVLAASGRAGLAVTNEALSRGYSVSAFVRNAKKNGAKSEFNHYTKGHFRP